jgi:hypothetical protein
MPRKRSSRNSVIANLRSAKLKQTRYFVVNVLFASR